MVFVGFMLFFDFLAVLARSWLHFGSILEGSGLHFGGFWRPFFHIFVRFEEAFVRTVLLNVPRVVFVGSMLHFDFLAVLAPSWPCSARFWKVQGSILEVFGVHQNPPKNRSQDASIF